MLSGRYGPYVKHGDVNATLPRGKEPTALTMNEAVQLIAERAAKGPSKSKSRRARGSKAGTDDAKAAKSKSPAKSKARAKGKTGGTREAAE